MLDKSGIIKRLMLSNQKASAEIKALKGPEKPGLLAYQKHIHQYVLDKFLLDDEEEIHTDDINELAKKSVEKAGKLNPNEATLLDVSKHCGATSSFMTKKVLLYLALAEDLGVNLQKYDMSEIETTGELAALLYRETQTFEDSYVYLDNAATAPVEDVVINQINERIIKCNANVHRGIYRLSEESTARYEGDRAEVADYLHVTPKEIIFTSGATESLNRAAEMVSDFVCEGDQILTTVFEHHSNFLPWQQLALRKGATLVVATSEEELESKLTEKTRIVALTHCSNVLGTYFDVQRICNAARKAGAISVVDGAQAIAHAHPNLREINCDFYAFSGHKIGATTGIGVLYVNEGLIKKLSPVSFGGGMVKKCSLMECTFEDAPYCFEAGTPNFVGATGLATALRHRSMREEDLFLKEQGLMKHLVKGLSEIKGLHLLSDAALHHQKQVCASFTVEGAHPYDIAILLDKKGFAVRSGMHCAMPLMTHLGILHAVRVSPSYRNTKEEIDRFLQALQEVLLICCRSDGTP